MSDSEMLSYDYTVIHSGNQKQGFMFNKAFRES